MKFTYYVSGYKDGKLEIFFVKSQPETIAKFVSFLSLTEADFMFWREQDSKTYNTEIIADGVERVTSIK